MKNKEERYYQQRLKKVQEEYAKAKSKVNRVSTYRLLAIIASAVIFYFLLKTTILFTAIAGVCILFGFYKLVKYHDKLSDDLELKTLLLKVIQNEIGVSDGKKSIYGNGAAFEDIKHPYTGDLDVFGEFSLFHKVNRAKTAGGLLALANSFLKNAGIEEVYQRQEAVKELEIKPEWRQNFQASLFSIENAGIEQLSALEKPPKLKFEGLIKAYFYIKWLVPFLIVAAFYFVGLTVGMSSIAFFLFLHYGISGANKELTAPYFSKIKGASRELDQYRLAVDLILDEKWSSSLLRNGKERIPETHSGQNPILSFKNIVKKIEMKDNQFAAFFLYLFSPFDLVQLVQLREWINKNPEFFEKILSSIARFELYGSLGTLAFNEKDWTYPVIEEDNRVNIKMVQAGHPLIAGAVCNDFDLGKTNQLSLITGSNMSGKSTFLRTTGCNILLAYLGAPVCAKEMIVSEGIQLYSYMRIKDSLQENASTFKAEIDKIRMLLTAMNSPKALVLVDEMLRGTNSEDKLKGSIAFLEEVIKKDAFAMVATHDLRTTEIAERYPEQVKNFYFEYDSKDGELTFDYLLKEGVCQSFNASELLRSVGLNV
ncbi:MutS-related protein [Jiulongibacter sp. NS-SX5]|uniref:MutS-related protein n=1 Tax=Jiulongibacter sp. NS-SX5 TaxID=3463854 RepID=UPI004058D92F